MLTIRAPKLHPAQAAVRNNPARFLVLACGRRWGKTRLGSLLAIQTAINGGRAWWVAPSYPVSQVGWRMVRNLASQIPGSEIRRGDLMAVLPNGGSVRVRSGDNPDSLRGEGLDLAILDECAFMSEDVWREAIRPALSDRQGKALFISTPKGRNWFWSMYQRGVAKEEGWASFTYPTSANPFIIQLEIDAARRDLPELVFRQEYLAEFVDMEGSVFRRIQDAATCTQIEAPEPGRQYAAGVDVAASVDYTVVTIMDIEARRMVYMDRYNRVDYNALEDRLAALAERWRLTSMTIETNSIGQPVIDRMYARGLPVIPYTTTSATKQRAIMALQSAFEHGEISILNNPVLVGELLSFESKRSPSGSYTYSAPAGMHDDCVMSLAFAWHAIGDDGSNLVG